MQRRAYLLPLIDAQIEVERLMPEAINPTAPAIVLLHEGLGSVAMWRDFPENLAQKIHCEVIVYSRRGYGKSTPLGLGRNLRAVNYMHDEAQSVLPALIRALDLSSKPVLLGHSDGASIALISAGMYPEDYRALVIMAPHVMVEEITVKNIAAAKVAFETTDLPQKLARFHDQPESMFWGWNDIWLNRAFLDWNIESYLPNIQVPILAIQGLNDEYGTAVQVNRIVEAAPFAQSCFLADCRHAPHKDQAEEVLNRINTYFSTLI